MHGWNISFQTTLNFDVGTVGGKFLQAAGKLVARAGSFHESSQRRSIAGIRCRRCGPTLPWVGEEQRAADLSPCRTDASIAHRPALSEERRYPRRWRRSNHALRHRDDQGWRISADPTRASWLRPVFPVVRRQFGQLRPNCLCSRTKRNSSA